MQRNLAAVTMLYRLAPHSPLEWTDTPVRDIRSLVHEHDLDLDGLDWQPTDERVFSGDLLRIALRHGIRTTRALAVEAAHTVDLGRSDHLRVSQQEIDELQAEHQAKNGPAMEQLLPGWTQRGTELDERVREATDRAADRADAGLANVLAAPVDPDLAAHWTALGGRLPDPA